MYFEKTYVIDSRDVDCFNLCRPSAVLGYLQDAAGMAAAQFHASNPEMVTNHHCCWMVARTKYVLDRPLGWLDQLTVKTWHRGCEKPLMYRDFDLLVNGAPAGWALSIWTLVDLDSHALVRASQFPQFSGTDGGDLARDTKLPRLTLPEGLAPVEDRRFHYSDTDPNGHVNNTRYADLICDALRLESAPGGSFVRELQVGYLQQCLPGETVTLLSAADGPRRYVLGRDAAGTARFQGCLVLG